MDCGAEIRLFDPRRNPQDWTELIRPTECAVFLKNRTTSTAVGQDGQPFASSAAATCIVFANLDAAQRFCEAKVRELPHLRCEIYDAEGLARQPFAVILHPDFQRKEDGGSLWSRRRKLIAAALVLVSAPLFWIGVESPTSGDVAIFLGINCIVLALRFVYWDAAVRHRERERSKRLEAHRQMERRDA